MGKAILEGLQLLKHRKEEYKANGISFYRPWIFLITDGEPTDEWQTAAALIKEGEQNKSFAFFTVAVQNANINNLKQIAVREPLKLQGLKFRDLFQWLSNSMKAVSSSTPGITVQLATPNGWPMSEWKIISASEKGTSHIQSADPCQDYRCFEVLDEISGEKFLLAVVADGAGSALKPIEGAEQVCNFIIGHIKEWLLDKQGVFFSSEIVQNWVDVTHEFIVDYAAKEEMQPRDFACTLLGAVIGKRLPHFFKLVMVPSYFKENKYKVIFWPENGEYANMTYFVTDEEALNHLQVLIDVAPDELAIFSDGFQRLALIYESKTVHTPFFTPMFKRLQNSETSNLEVLQEELHQFLSHPRVNERTDDDKTLILATRLSIETTAL